MERQMLFTMGLYAGLGVAFSFFVHEMGHALMARLLGHKPSVVLYLLGGTTHSQSERMPAYGSVSVLVSLAGPFLSLSLGFLILLLVGGTDARGLESALLSASALTRAMAWVAVLNVAWSAVNLLPMSPLDGGRVLVAALGRNRAWMSAAVSAAVAASLGVAAFSYERYLLALLLAYLAVRALLSRPALDVGVQASETRIPQVSDITVKKALAHAEAQLECQEFDKATVIAHTVASLRSGTRLGGKAVEIALWARLGAGDATGVKQVLAEFGKTNDAVVDPYVLAAALEATDDLEMAVVTCRAAVDRGDRRPELQALTVRLLLASGAYAEAACLAKGLTDVATAEELRRVADEVEKGGAAAEAAELSFCLARSKQGCFSDAVQSTVGFLATHAISRAKLAFQLAREFDARRASALLQDPRFSIFCDPPGQTTDLSN